MFESFLGVNPWTSLFILLNTLTIYFVAKKFLFGPVMNIIETRQKEIDDLYESASTAQAEADFLRQEYQLKLSDARSAAEDILRDATLRGQSREEEILRQANAEASALMAKASRDIEQERRKALQEAKSQISGIALAIAGKVVERELTQEDQTQLIDQFIVQLGDGV